MDQRKKLLIVEWGSTALVIASVILTSFNIYPLNVWIAFVGNFGWIVIGYLWKKWSLIIISIIISAIYVVGLVNFYF